MKVQHDVMRMAGTKEKREPAHQVVRGAKTFFKGRFEDGLAFARQCEHWDALFLVSLFPHGAPKYPEHAVAVFLARREDARCLCWAAVLMPEAEREPLKRSAEMGYSWGETFYGSTIIELNNPWHKKAAAQGEPVSISHVAFSAKCKSHGEDLAEKLYREAASLGDEGAQENLGKYYCAKGSVEQYQWMRRSAFQGCTIAEIRNEHTVKKQLRIYDEGGSGRVIFEIGFTAAYCSFATDEDTERQLHRAELLYNEWCSCAKQRIRCWLWLSKRLGVVKDIRRLVAEMVWEERAEWSDRREAAIALKAAKTTRYS